MKRLKQGAARLLGSLIQRYSPPGRLPRVTVLCYHSVHPTKSFATVSPAHFDAHLSWLGIHTRVIPFSNIFSALQSPEETHYVALSFDDGYADNYEYAVPLLAKHGMTAIFFPIAGLVEGNSSVVERCRMLQRTDVSSIRPMDWSQLREMEKAGMEVGSHTYSHPNLSTLGRHAAHWEFLHSREVLEHELGRPVRHLAYPFGNPGRHVLIETAEVASEAGYELAASILYRGVRSNDSRWVVPRFTIARDTLPTLRAKVFGHWDYVGSVQQRHPRWGRMESSREPMIHHPEFPTPLTN